MVSVGGNLYSVPDCTRRRVVEVHTLANEIRILEDDKLIAVHPVLEGRGQRRIAGGRRMAPPPGNSMTAREMPPPPTTPAGAIVVPRSLAFYDAVTRRLAGEGGWAGEATSRGPAPSIGCAAHLSGSKCRGRSKSSTTRCASSSAARSARWRQSTPCSARRLTLREGRRVKAALKMGRLVSIKTLAGFDFAFQPSLDRNRILALAQLEFIDRHEVVHFLGQPGCGKTHLAIALGVEAVKAGRGVYFCTLGVSSQ
jgi:hypothetical protein